MFVVLFLLFCNTQLGAIGSSQLAIAELQICDTFVSELVLEAAGRFEGC